MPKKDLEINDADVPVVPIGRVDPPALKANPEQSITEYEVVEDGELDALDRQVIDALSKAAAAQGRPIDLSKFSIGSRKQMIVFPGGQYLKWVVSFKSHWTGKHLRTDPHMWPKGDYFSILNELEALNKLG